MVAGVVLPDMPVALVQMLKADPDVAALVGPRVSLAFPEGRRAWDLRNNNAIVIRPRGGPAPSIETEQRTSRVDISFFAAGASPNTRRRIARQIWRTAEPVLVPPPNAGLAMGGRFVDLGLFIKWIHPELGEPYLAPEPGTDMERAVMPYLVCWSRLRTN